MAKPAQFMFRSGCLISVLAPIAAIVLYPRARWLFALVLLGIALLAIAAFSRKESSPQDVAELAERILNGTSAGWDVDTYEHLNPKDSALRDLWHRTLELGLPEEWPRLDEGIKDDLRTLIAAMRELPSAAARAS